MIAASGNGVGRAPQRSRADAAPGRGDWVTKIGAEGVQAIGIRSQGIGIAIKVADGNKRGLYPAIVAVLDAARRCSTPRRAYALWRHGPGGRVRNYRGIVTGEVRPAVACARPQSVAAAGDFPHRKRR